MPALFVGHGSPMNAVEDNEWSQAWRDLGRTLPKPRAILAVSAHWYTRGTFVGTQAVPKTIHDFGGFPPELFAMQYPAPGEPTLAQRVLELTARFESSANEEWGLDHGTWSVLVHLFPDADIPVVQLSIDAQRPTADHVAIGRALRPLREDGVLIFASGNITHNLRDGFQRMQTGNHETPDWAAEFDGIIAAGIQARDDEALTKTLTQALGRNAHPTPDHYLPLLYAYGASDGTDAATYPVQGFSWGSLSMRSVLWTTKP